MVEFVGGPLGGTSRLVPATADGRPPGRFTIDVGRSGAAGSSKHDYRVDADRPDGQPWRYEYRGIRPG